jgi:hypothetical protein
MSLQDSLPPSLNLSAHLSAHKYFFVCTLTVAAWDTLVLSPRSWKMVKAKDGWPVLKILYNFLRVFMPVEFIVVGQSPCFFSTVAALELIVCIMVISRCILRYQVFSTGTYPFFKP